MCITHLGTRPQAKLLPCVISNRNDTSARWPFIIIPNVTDEKTKAEGGKKTAASSYLSPALQLGCFPVRSLLMFAHQPQGCGETGISVSERWSILAKTTEPEEDPRRGPAFRLCSILFVAEMS